MISRQTKWLAWWLAGSAVVGYTAFPYFFISLYAFFIGYPMLFVVSLLDYPGRIDGKSSRILNEKIGMFMSDLLVFGLITYGVAGLFYGLATLNG